MGTESASPARHAEARGSRVEAASSASESVDAHRQQSALQQPSHSRRAGAPAEPTWRTCALRAGPVSGSIIQEVRHLVPRAAARWVPPAVAPCLWRSTEPCIRRLWQRPRGVRQTDAPIWQKGEVHPTREVVGGRRR